MRPPVILITCDVQEAEGQPTETLLRLRLNYTSAIAAVGGLPLILPPAPDMLESALDLCNGVLLSGSDAGVIVPGLRADHESRLIARSLARRLPIFGICHGMQALGQALGGTVLRDVPALLEPHSSHLPSPVPDRTAHPVQVTPGNFLHRLTGADSISVNSLHRHALSSDGHYVVTAIAPDGVTEAIDAERGSFCAGVQWHPEYQLTDADTRLLEAFLAAARDHQQKSESETCP
ncbi:gamma-glutamyl-gamma-aminobutyrate hydrolase family protein [Tabrizicola sp.]|uniref:gamma-glutamyl-gamma-aminobutyrate hydrolase family protein n=1 Tax=Tabrizicola sp. TaxID=2005166 RepID=UPI002602A08D|nr:gamma-glutamyl-gamma-aminobutyrate hydrolase family protein [Tabrizicola sp.]MDM7931516.1 gamma-glutamyl-gamma-aminobutyrate hydrolase family protein [Tabrizicola sp.]